MLKGLWRKLTNKTDKIAENTHASNKVSQGQKNKIKTKTLSRDQHNISRRKISKNALKVLYRLKDSGFESYLVGGGVRDILLGLSPKDFDIATAATPEQVKSLFSNCRLVGRRFRLAHIMFGRDIIEVATFRANHVDSCQTKAQTSDQGMLVRDNVYGTLVEDAFRRDFTVNALYYSVKDFSVIDHVGGLEDLEKNQLKLIGDPEARYREDPVRILRAIRLSSKLNLSIAPSTAAPIEQLANLLAHVSAARLWDESNKLFLTGYANSVWQGLNHYCVLPHIMPNTMRALEKDQKGYFGSFIEKALTNTDKRIAQQQPVTPAFLFAVFLWVPQQQLKQTLMEKGLSPYEADQKSASKIIDLQRETIAIPKRFSITVREIWSLQFRLSNRKKRNIDSLIQHPKFRAAYDFLCLRCEGDAALTELAQWWTDFQESDPEIRHKMLNQVNSNSRRKRSHNRKRKLNTRSKNNNSRGRGERKS